MNTRINTRPILSFVVALFAFTTLFFVFSLPSAFVALAHFSIAPHEHEPRSPCAGGNFSWTLRCDGGQCKGRLEGCPPNFSPDGRCYTVCPTSSCFTNSCTATTPPEEPIEPSPPPSASLSSPDVVSTPPDTDLTKQGPQADVKLTWSSTDASSCTASSAPSVPAWNGSKTVSGNQTIKLSGGTYDFSLTCTGDGGSATATSSTRVVSLDLWGQDSVYKPDSFYLDWATHHILSPLTKSSSPSNPQWQGTASSSSPDGRRMSALLDSELFQRGTTTFSLTGTGLTKTVTDTHRIRFYEIPRCSFNANPTRIVLPNPSTLSWECKYANSCSIDQGIGTVSPRTGSLSVRPPRTTTYTLSCTGPDGGNSFQTTVSVGFHGRIREIFPLKLEDPANLLAQAMKSVSEFFGMASLEN